MMADWAAAPGCSVRVWVIEHKVLAHGVLATRSVAASKDLVWALVEATSVKRMGNGVCVSFAKSAAQGWYPPENVSWECKFDHDVV